MVPAKPIPAPNRPPPSTGTADLKAEPYDRLKAEAREALTFLTRVCSGTL